MQLLADRGASLFALDVDGWLPMMHADYQGREEAKELLRRLGAGVGAWEEMADWEDERDQLDINGHVRASSHALVPSYSRLLNMHTALSFRG